MTGNSIILCEYDKACGAQNVIQSTGCSEYIAHSAGLKRYATLCFELLNATPFGVVCRELGMTPVEHMEAWTRFVYDAFLCLNVAEKPFTSLYTFGDLLAEKKHNVSGNLSNLGIHLSNTNELNVSGYKYTLASETVIGVQVDVKALRAHFKYKYYEDGKIMNSTYNTEQARKVQLTHTALRYGWSSAYRVGITALNLAKLIPNTDKFQILQISYFLNNIFNRNLYEYGTLYVGDSNKFISKEFFLRNWNDPTKNGVITHFMSSQDPILAMLGISYNKDMSALSSFNEKKLTQNNVLNPTQEFANYIASWIQDNDREGIPPDIAVKFKFIKTIFRATVEKAQYDGFKKPGKTIDRIIFRDEEGTILSIAQKSKLIEIL